jgi:DNA-binding sugar fermentation-stimulating protein
MEIIDIELPEEEFERLNSEYPFTMQSAKVGNRSVAIVKWHFRTIDPNCKVDNTRTDLDLRVTIKEKLYEIEIKGTADEDIAWMKLKVSGKRSYEKLKNGMPLYRVCNVYSKKPRIFILNYNDDFDMIPGYRR